MKKRSMSMASLTVFLLLAISSLTNAIDDKCAACKAVAEELEIGLSSEKPRNHLDMRHRLDSKGQRQGKLIDYRVSELRVVELLDDLCENMQDYTINKDTKQWFKVHSWNSLSSYKQEAKAYAKDISTYCGRMLEETEDELSELIKKGSVKVGGVSKVLCQDLSKHCSQVSVSNEADVDDDEDNGEL